MAATVSNVSSMLRSAQSLQTKQIAYNDDVAAYNFSNSEQTQDDYNKYVAYLKGQSTKTSDPTKLLSYQKTVDSAFKAYSSNEIQRSAISVLEGGGTLSDKQTTVGTLYSQAINNGDLNLATNLRQQYDNIDVEIQKQQVAAQQAAQTLATTQSNAAGHDYRDSAVQLQVGLKQLTAEYKSGGSQAFNAALKSFVKQNSATFTAMGVKIPTGATTSIAQVSQGVIEAIGQYYNLASQATSVSDPSASDTYKNDMMGIITGSTKFETPYGSHSYDFIKSVATNPNLYVETQGTDGQFNLVKSTLSGYKMVNGAIQPVASGTTVPNTQPINGLDSKGQKDQLQKLGFTVVGNKDGQIQVQLTDKTAHWLPAGKINTANNEELSLIPTNGGYQFTSTDSKGSKHLYTVATDAAGLAGVVETNNKGQNVGVHGQYGFNNKINSATTGSTVAAKAQQQQAVQKQIQAAQAKTISSLTSNNPLAAPNQPNFSTGPKPTSTPLTTISKPAAYVAPSAIKPGTKLTAAEQAQANMAVTQLLSTKNTGLINNTIGAIQKSAGFGNPYDQFKLTLLASNPNTSQYTVKTGTF